MDPIQKNTRQPDLIDVFIVYFIILLYMSFGGSFFALFVPVWASLFFTLGLFIIPSLYVLARRMDFKSSFGFRTFSLPTKNDKTKKYFFSGAFRLAIGILLVELVGSLLISPFVAEPTPVSELINNYLLSGNYIVGIIVVALFPAVFEELLCRGFILTALRGRISSIKAIILCSFLFALLHFDPIRIPFTFIAGLSLSWVAWKTGSVVLPIFMHFIHNFTLFSLAKIGLPASDSIDVSGGIDSLNSSSVYNVSTLLLCAFVFSLGLFFIRKGVNSVLSGCTLELNSHSETGL